MVDTKKLGDGFTFIILSGLLLVLLVSMAFGIEGGTTDVRGGEAYVNTNLSSTGYQVLMLDPSGVTCRDAFQVWDPDDGTVLSEPENYHVLNLTDCALNLTRFQDQAIQDHDVAVAWEYEDVDSDGVAVMTVVTRLADMYVVWLVPLALALMYLLWAMIIRDSIKRKEGGRT